jgi:hypothetical protein
LQQHFSFYVNFHFSVYFYVHIHAHVHATVHAAGLGNMFMQHGQATWICGMSIKREDCDMKHGNAAGTGGCKAWTCTLACRMGLQNENAAWTSSISIFVLFHVHLFIFIFCSFYCSDSMFIRNAHAAWACSVKRSMDIAWRQRNGASS